MGCGAVLLSAGLPPAIAGDGAADSAHELPSHKAAARSYIVTDFDSVRVEAPIAVAIASRRGVTARGEGEAAMLERIELKVSGRVLTVRLKPSPFEGARAAGDMPARLFLTAPALRAVQLAGSGAMLVDGLRGDRAEVVASGSGSLRVANIDSANLSVTQSGAGQLRLAGKAGNAALRVSGSGEVNASALTISDLDLTAEGAATTQALATRSAKIVAIGSASVDVDGHPACTVRHVGSGTVVCGGMDY
jgi:hypothetical protein